MLDVLRQNPLALVMAVIMHVVIVAFLVVGVDWREKPRQLGSDVKIVQARVVDQKKLDAEINRLKKVEQDKKAQVTAAKRKEEKKLADLKKRREAEKRKLEKIKKDRKAREKSEKKKREQAKKKAAAEKKKIAILENRKARLKKKQEQEKKRLAELQQTRKAEEKARVEAKKKVRAEAERKKKVAAEKKRKAEVARRKAAEKKKREAVQARVKAEREAREAELIGQMQAEQDEAETARVVSAIRDKVNRNWRRPLGTAELGLRCKVQVRLGANGSVLRVSVIESSGNGAFDRSVEQAVYKADPLPMPASKRLVGQFRELEFIFDPALR